MAEQGTTYAAFIENQGRAEYERRTVLDARGLGIVTTNGAFTTLIFGILVVLKGKNFTLGLPAEVALIVALTFLILSAGAGVYATQLVKYSVPDYDTLRAMLKADHWKDSEVTARYFCASATIRTIESLGEGSDRKAGRIVAAVYLQLAGFAALAASVGIDLLSG